MQTTQFTTSIKKERYGNISYYDNQYNIGMRIGSSVIYALFFTYNLIIICNNIVNDNNIIL